MWGPGGAAKTIAPPPPVFAPIQKYNDTTVTALCVKQGHFLLILVSYFSWNDGTFIGENPGD